MYLEDAFGAILSFDDEAKRNLACIGVGNAFAVPDVGSIVVGHFAMAVDRFQIDPDKRTSNHLIKQHHDLRISGAPGEVWLIYSNERS